MTRAARLALFAVAAPLLGTVLVVAFTGLPHFGTDRHPYGDRAVRAALQERHTANTVASVTFDQRGVDTLGEEFILFISVVGVAVLLRRATDESREEPSEGERPRARVMDAVRLLGHLLLGLTTMVGGYVVAHGHLSPGGGFQGGVVLGTGIHLVYVAGSYRSLEKVRPLALAEIGEAVGGGAFAALGVAGTVAMGAFLGNFLPYGQLRAMASAGTVPLLNLAVGIEVASSVVVMIAKFLEQAVVIEEEGGQ